MPLPKIDVPLFTLDLPLSKQTVRFRPFLVKEEKIFLIAMESDDEKVILDAIKQIINNCCVDSIEIDSLPIVDVEFLFLNLRARSVGETVELQYKCNNNIKNENGEEVVCGNKMKFNVNLLDVKPELLEKHTNNIKISDNLGIVMKYPDMSILSGEEFTAAEDVTIDKVMEVILKSIDYIYDEETIYYKKDVSDKEMIDFIESLTQSQFKYIQDFFETSPKLQKTINFKCNKCGYQEEIVVEGLQSFFA